VGPGIADTQVLGNCTGNQQSAATRCRAAVAVLGNPQILAG
jgi:hypothetical protein